MSVRDGEEQSAGGFDRPCGTHPLPAAAEGPAGVGSETGDGGSLTTPPRPSLCRENARPQPADSDTAPVLTTCLRVNGWIQQQRPVCVPTNQKAAPDQRELACSGLLLAQTLSQNSSATQGHPVAAMDRNKNRTVPRPYLVSKHGQINIRTWSKPQKRPDVTSVLAVTPAKPVLSHASSEVPMVPWGVPSPPGVGEPRSG